MMAAISPGKAKGLEEVATHIDRWEAMVLALSRDLQREPQQEDEGSHLDLHAALNFQHALVQQAEKVQGLQEYQRQGRDHRGGEAGAQECDAVHQSTGHAEAWPEDGREAYDVDAVHSKGSVQLRRTGPHHSKVRYVRSSQGQGEGRR